MYQFYFKARKFWGVVLLAAALGANTSYAQTKPKIDSLETRLSSTVGAARFDILYDLVFASLSQEDFGRSLSYIEQAQENAKQFGDSLKIVKTSRVRAQILRRLGRIQDAIGEFETVLPIAKRNNYSSELELALNGLAIIYTDLANYDKALQYHFECLVLKEKSTDHEGLAVSLNNIGLVYFKLRNFEMALDYYTRALKEHEDIQFKDRLLINIGLCYIELNDPTTAIQFIDDGLRICAPNCTDRSLMQGEFGFGKALLSLRKPDEAEKHFQISYQLSKKLDDKSFTIYSLIFLGRINIKEGKFELSRKLLDEAQANAGETAYNEEILSIYSSYAKLFDATNDYKNAALYQGKYIKLRDSIFSSELIKNLAKVQTNYEERDNLKTIKDQDAILALKEETLLRQSAENRFYVVVTIMVFALAALMLLLFRLTRRANERLESRVDIRTKELNDSNDALKKVNSEMDNFIYKTSHDIRGPLASLKGICNVAIMDVNDPTALGYLKKLDNTAEKLNLILTRLLIINQVNHAVLAANVINFEEIIEDILYVERKKGIPKRMNISYEVSKGFTMKSDREMLRIVMENLIDNSIKFYNESERYDPFVRIHVGALARYVVITVTDNGLGINDETKEKIFQMFVRASERSETGGIGLYLSKLATSRLDGSIDFSMTSDKYTEFTVRLPLDLGPILEQRNEQERILEFERGKQAEKQKKVTST